MSAISRGCVKTLRLVGSLTGFSIVDGLLPFNSTGALILYARIAAMSGLTPMMAITRLIL